MITQLTDFESEVFWYCADGGGRTTQSVIKRWGPKPKWSRLIERRYLRTVDTVYGEVLGVADAGRDMVRCEYPEDFKKLPYLMAPNTLADRAYQQDAITALEQEGYTVHYHTYKTASPLVTRHRGGERPSTHQITGTCLRVPETEAQILVLRWNQHVKMSQELSNEDIYAPQLGFPSLYATISGGGLSTQRVKALYQQASLQSSDWRSPMLVVVPDLSQHRDVLRRVSAEQAANKLADLNSQPRTHHGSYAVMRLIEQPLPSRVIRKSR